MFWDIQLQSWKAWNPQECVGNKQTFISAISFLAELGKFLLNMMAFVASIDRQLELQFAGSCMKIGHNSAWHCDTQVPLMDCPSWITRNIMKERLICIVFLDVAVMKAGKKPCDHSLSIHTMCVGQVGTWGWSTGIFSGFIFLWSSTESSPDMYIAASLCMFLKVHPFPSNSFACLRLSTIMLFLQRGYRLVGMVLIAWTCPLHNCSHLGKAVGKPSTVLESPSLLHNSAPKFGLSFIG